MISLSYGDLTGWRLCEALYRLMKDEVFTSEQAIKLHELVNERTERRK